ncbi:MAG: 2Fe-2S iron-sulfur cluster binding domain-containing protein [Magnetospiraceae bacterium]
MKRNIHLCDVDESFVCDEQESVLEGMLRLGRRGIPVGCRGGGCGVCKVEITDGQADSKVMSRAHVSLEDLAEGRVLACRIYPKSDLSLRVIGKMKKVWDRPAQNSAAQPRQKANA